MSVYYNEIDPFCVAVLRECIKRGVISDGIVDDRSIEEVDPKDLREFKWVHFFAGGGFWDIAARRAGYPTDETLWTGSCPCQPFSNAGKRAGTSDTRHLWPHFHRLIAAAKPSVVFGEQVSSKLGYDWFDGVASDLESQDYQCEAVDIPACAVNAPHKRNRLYWIARLLGNPDEGDGRRWIQTEEQLRNESFAKSSETNVADSEYERTTRGNEIEREIPERDTILCEKYWSDFEWRTGKDGKSRRVKPGISLLAHGISRRVDKLHIGGNAIVVPLATEFIKAFLESREGELSCLNH